MQLGHVGVRQPGHGLRLADAAAGRSAYSPGCTGPAPSAIFMLGRGRAAVAMHAHGWSAPACSVNSKSGEVNIACHVGHDGGRPG